MGRSEKARGWSHDLINAWLKVAPILGWYDYIFGKQYSLPRVYFHRMAEDLRYAHKNGVRVYYAESYPPPNQNWGEGPKLYLTARLLWNPNTLMWTRFCATGT